MCVFPRKYTERPSPLVIVIITFVENSLLVRYQRWARYLSYLPFTDVEVGSERVKDMPEVTAGKCRELA